MPDGSKPAVPQIEPVFTIRAEILALAATDRGSMASASISPFPAARSADHVSTAASCPVAPTGCGNARTEQRRSRRTTRSRPMTAR